MNKEELITKQQLEIEQLRIKCESNKELVRDFKGLLYGIGRPLNDNILGLNKEQLKWVFEIDQLVDKVDY